MSAGLAEMPPGSHDEQGFDVFDKIARAEWDTLFFFYGVIMAAGVALMGPARGHYTFFGHLKWTPAIALGYFASIYVHFLING
jgi:Na+/H+ antiporter NhaD/arsenite permease-like protein